LDYINFDYITIDYISSVRRKFDPGFDKGRGLVYAPVSPLLIPRNL